MSDRNRGRETYNLSKAIAEKYYKNRDRFKEEESKARAYAKERRMDNRGAYKFLDKDIDVVSGSEPMYRPISNKIVIPTDEEHIRKLERFKKRNMDDADYYAVANNYGSMEDMIKSQTNRDETLEHEGGHAYSMRVTSPEKNMFGMDKTYSTVDTDESYFTKPTELKNGLGKIQRESYMIHGRRFERPEELKEYVNKTPFEKATEGFSDEAKRTWRVLYDNKDQEPTDGKMKLLDWASKAAPAFVYRPTFEFGVT